jgi:hypothetical protein
MRTTRAARSLEAIPVKKQNRRGPAPKKKNGTHSKATPDVRKKNESVSEVEEQLRLGRKIMKEYREVFERLAKE